VLNTQLGAILMSDNRAWARTGTDALLAAVFFASAWILIPMWKAQGLAMAFAIAYTAASLTLWICLKYQPARKPAFESSLITTA
jgi:O-antigen/teichoic acid export membrane protein